MDDYAEWTRAEIARKRKQGETLLAQADGMEEALVRWEEAKRGSPARETAARANGHAKPARRKVAAGSGTGLVMATIAQGAGVTNEELFTGLAEAGLSMKRTSMRSILSHAKSEGQITSRDGKWFPAEKGPNA